MARPGSALLVLTALLAVVALAACEEPNFSYFLFVRQHIGTFCKEKPCPLVHHRPFHFTIHGLWPNYDDGTWPEYCDSTRPFDEELVEDLLPEMEEEWPTMFDDNDAFWSHEWTRHGTCAAKVLPGEHKYFRTVLDLHAKYDIAAALKAADITPSDTKEYRGADVAGAIQKAYGAGAIVHCDARGQLTEVWMCVDRELNAIDCPESHGALPSPGSRRLLGSSSDDDDSDDKHKRHHGRQDGSDDDEEEKKEKHHKRKHGDSSDDDEEEVKEKHHKHGHGKSDSESDSDSEVEEEEENQDHVSSDDDEEEEEHKGKHHSHSSDDDGEEEEEKKKHHKRRHGKSDSESDSDSEDGSESDSDSSESDSDSASQDSSSQAQAEMQAMVEANVMYPKCSLIKIPVWGDKGCAKGSKAMSTSGSGGSGGEPAWHRGGNETLRTVVAALAAALLALGAVLTVAAGVLRKPAAHGYAPLESHDANAVEAGYGSGLQQPAPCVSTPEGLVWGHMVNAEGVEVREPLLPPFKSV